jgi:putative ABC transport system ATP-binding protein|uniref:ABC transporter ATP-binding protein n=1 Tax=Desulfobacca acetoxidans TaxID=60893 RepID=A0A7C5ERM9_9BACT
MPVTAPVSRQESDPPLVEIAHLYKSYRRGSQVLPVLQDISLTIRAGEFLALMGPSGSGKTTLLNLIAGLDRPDQGVLLVGGVSLPELTEAQLAAWRARHVGFIFQFYHLIPVLTAFENVELPLLLTPLTRRERREHVELALELVGLSDRMHHYPAQLSGGQQQRVAIARAFITDPTIISADEPTGDLDKASAREVMDLLCRLNQEFGKTVILVTHDPEVASRAPRLIRLVKGELIMDEKNDHAAGGFPLVGQSFTEEG